jgi:uncharacterized protein
MGEDIQEQYKKRYLDAINSFVDKVRSDQNVIAVVVSGSVTYDVVWEKSDIDMTVIIRDQTLQTGDYCVLEDGITIHAELMPRSRFKRFMEGSWTIGGSFMQSYFANARLIYTTDDSLYEYLEEMKEIGADDIPLTALHNAAEVFHYRKKSMKWIMARKDPLYAQYFLIMAAEAIARMELCLRGIPFNRDGVKKALELEPELLRPFYQDAMSHHYSEEEIMKAIQSIDAYLVRNIEVIQQPVIDYLSDQEVKTVTMLNKHFHSSGDALTYVFDFLAERGIIEKVSETIRLTPKSKKSVEEIAYLYVPQL